jgi:hypothetical protein
VGENWSLTLRVGLRLRVFENRVLRRIFEPKKDDTTREWKQRLYILLLRSLMICTTHRVFLEDHIERNEMARSCSTYGRKEPYTGFWWGNVRERTTWKTQA